MGEMKLLDCNDGFGCNTHVLPLNPKKYFYKHVVERGKDKLVPVEYSALLGTNFAGFSVEENGCNDGVYDSDSVTLTNTMSSIVVSKNNDKVIKLTYACGNIVNVEKAVMSHHMLKMIKCTMA